MASPMSASPSGGSALPIQQGRPNNTSSSNSNLSSSSGSLSNGEPNEAPHALHTDLAHSLKHLTISTSATPPLPPSPSPSAPRSSTSRSRSLAPATGRSPSSSRPGSALRSPLHSSSSSLHSPSRSATPTLLRKASMNSLHSANGVAPPRRSSSANLPPTPSRSLASISPELPERILPTAQSIARTHFAAELEAHHGSEVTCPVETIVFLHDACYGHRYSRPRTSRVQLSTIVERPERIKACALGVAAAYVRLGDRHQDGAFPIHPSINPAGLPTIPFRIQKSTRRLSLTSQTVTNVHGQKWMEELKIMCDAAESKLAAGGKELQRPDMDRGPNAEAPQKFHEGDLYLCSESLDALEGALGAVCDAVDAVFRPQGPQRALVTVRPPGHHCSSSHPSGFCWVNNVHVGIMHAILSHGLTHAAIIDFDLHHGDGSQSITWQHNARAAAATKNAAWWKKTSIGYFSLHDINSYPCEMGDEEKVRNASICIDNAHGQSIWNVHLQPWKTEADFWALYETKYSILLEKTRDYLRVQTERLRSAGLNSKAAIFLSAGLDASEWESAGMQRHSVNVPTEFYARLTRDVVRIAAEEGTSVEGRIISVLEGGYSDRALCSGVFSHLCGLAGDGPLKEPELPAGLGLDMVQRPASVRGRKDSTASERGARRYDSTWWSKGELESLEAQINAPPAPEIRQPRQTTPPTYSSPTQASTAKAVTPRLRRTPSGYSPGNARVAVGISRGPTPPPPDVPWTVAAHELGKLLIPSGRQTNSCTHEDLNAEATKLRRDRQTALAQATPSAPAASGAERAPTRMSLRERKAKPSYLDNGDEEDRKARRKTVADPSVIAAAKQPLAKQPRAGRRLSAASTLASDPTVPISPAPLTAPIRSAPKLEASRPDTAMSARTSSSTLSVKKTRAPLKKEPVPRAPRMPKKPAGLSAGGPSATSVESAHVKPPSAATAANQGDEMDQLAGEMKKIKISVITKAQREARERERAAREKLIKADTITVASPNAENQPLLKIEQPAALPSTPTDTTPTVFTPTTSAGAGSPEGLQPVQLPPSFAVPPIRSPLSNGPVTPTFPASPLRVPLPDSSPATAQASPTKEQGMDMFIPFQPEGPEPVTLPQQQPLHWMPPNVSATPAPTPMKRGNLPVFTATGTIPFAVSPVKNSAARGAVREVSEGSPKPGAN